MSESPVSLAPLGPPLVSARSAQIYPWAAGQVLKLFYEHIAPSSARWERINAEQAHAQGATRIECQGEVELDGRYGIILSRIEGTTLTASGERNPLTILRMGQLLAQQHWQVHQARSEQLQSIKSLLNQHLAGSALAFLTGAEQAKMAAYVQRLPEDNRLLHLDFHTDNILLDRHGATVIDWATAATGDIGADIAMSYFLFNEAELFPGINKAQELLYGSLRSFIYRSYRKHYLRLMGMSQEQLAAHIQRWYLPMLIYRLALWQAPTEVARLQQQIRDGIARLPEVAG
ncbi:aminoglycoside phosphotransferase family protein [Pseudomonas sp. 5P_3.1_Bac2]|uniref:aminoglycoside phosphotransferase family protein n=1 Tax=Pseudomonas sp. 5P_3.1_Bac2 TaxID=2971617 RepID=UPI0021C8510A|nr:phosphotransferase [Pseudomonas sp. 5P_3.1_Bac2]MCU1717380.1 phosphotransferase [Pseudomonas sp. 5P_3.1_Bac2]